MDLRCPHAKHAVLEEDYVEVKCRSRFCGAGPGTVVLHRFNKSTGELLDTLKFQDPAATIEERRGKRGTGQDSAAVRPS